MDSETREASGRRKLVRRHHVGSASAIREGSCHIVAVADEEIGIYRIDGVIRAIRNYCPHRGAPICKGLVSGTMLPSDPGEFVYGLDGQVLACPWHKWQFDLVTGRSLFDVDRRRLIQYEVEVDGDELYVCVPERRRRIEQPPESRSETR